jgi:hypothetical protein
MYSDSLVVREKYYVSGCATSSVLGKKKVLRSTPSILLLEDVFDCDTVFKT